MATNYVRILGSWGFVRFACAWLARRKRISLRPAPLRHEILIRRESSDRAVFNHVFMDEELAILAARKARVIIDAGANIGLSTAYLAHLFPQALIIAVEPDCENCVMLATNTANCGNVRIEQSGLWPTSGHLRIANPDEPAWALRCEPANANAPGAFPAVSFGDLLDRHGVARCDILKMDIEGAEREVFAESGTWIDRVGIIVVETHGPEARASLEAACPPHKWLQERSGEKFVLFRKDA